MIIIIIKIMIMVMVIIINIVVGESNKAIIVDIASLWDRRKCEKEGERLRKYQDLGPVSRKSRELFGPKKPFIKVRPTYSVKLVFSYVVKGIKIKSNCNVSCLETPSF